MKSFEEEGSGNSAALSASGQGLLRALDEKLLAAGHLLASSIMSGASRQVAAAVAVALWRALVDGKMHGDEISARLAHIRPVIEAKVVAAVCGQAVSISGSARAARNIAEHNFMEPIGELVKAAKRCQRGGKAKRVGVSLLRQVASDDEPKQAALASQADVCHDAAASSDVKCEQAGC